MIETNAVEPASAAHPTKASLSASPSAGEISVVICAFATERWAALREAVCSVQQQNMTPLEIIVVIDHNESLRAKAASELDNAIVILSDGQAGLSGARNTGVAHARGRVVAFLDDDAIAEADWLSHLAGGYDSPRVLGVGGRISPQWMAGRPRSFPTEFDWVIGCTYRGMPEARSTVRNLIGANMSFRRSVLAAAGGFEPALGRIGRYPAGCEETDFCIRARRRFPGGYFVYEPRAAVAHRVSPERASWRYFSQRCFAEGLSKAVVTERAGTRDGLATERTYTFRTLPAGIATGVTSALLVRDLAGALRATRIIVGLLIVTCGYLVGRVGRRLVRSPVRRLVPTPAGEPDVKAMR